MTESPAGLKPCKFCAEDIKEAATICRFCNRSQVEVVLELTPLAPPTKPHGKQKEEPEVNGEALEDAITHREFSRAISLLPASEQAAYREEVDRLRKNTGIAYLFYALLGPFGAEKFYIGESQWGALYLSCSILSGVILAFGGIGTIALACLTGASQLTSLAGVVIVSIIVSLFCSFVVSIGLLIDLFLIPRQVTKANEWIRLEILIDIANRIYPELRLPPLPPSQPPLMPLAVGLGSALLVSLSLCAFLGRLGDGMQSKQQQQPAVGRSQQTEAPPDITIKNSSAEEDTQTGTTADEDSARQANSIVNNYKSLIDTMLQAELAGDENTVSTAQTDLESLPKPTSGDHVESERLNKLGLAALKAKDYAEAASQFQAAAQADSGDAKYFSNLAFAEMHAGDLDTSYEHICSSISMAPSRAVAWDDLGLILAKKGQQDSAVAALMLANRASDDKGPKYLQALQNDEDQKIRDAATKALSKLQQTGQISSGEGQGLLTNSLPTKLNQCTITKISKIGSRLEDMPDSGDAIAYENGGYQVSYDKIPGLEGARVGDSVKMQLIKLPRQADGSPCPPGDNRGSVYRVTDLRTKKTWEAADSQHCCGGA